MDIGYQFAVSGLWGTTRPSRQGGQCWVKSGYNQTCAPHPSPPPQEVCILREDPGERIKLTQRQGEPSVMGYDFLCWGAGISYPEHTESSSPWTRHWRHYKVGSSGKFSHRLLFS